MTKTPRWYFHEEEVPTLRDQLAMAALQGVLAPQSTETGEWIVGTEEFIAQRSYQIADAMLAERSK